MLRRLLLWASTSPTLARRLPRLRFVRAAVSRFMPGEDVQSALHAAASLRATATNHTALAASNDPVRETTTGPTARSLVPKGAVLSRLGENVTTREDALAATASYEDALDAIAHASAQPQIGAGPIEHISVKLTHLGLDQDLGFAASNLDRILVRAEAIGSAVWIDMESSNYVDRTLDVFRGALRRHSNLGICLQAYLYRTPDDLEALLDVTRSIRLVKGAYAESASNAIQERDRINDAFHELALHLLTSATGPPRRSNEEAASGLSSPPPVLGTHDGALVDRIAADASDAGVIPGGYEVQMLYGIRPDELSRLARLGHTTRVFICYGPEWYPWFVRRIAEKPSNLWFVARQLF